MLDRDWTQKQIVILAFDHRGSFMKKLFGISERNPTEKETKEIADYKMIVYQGFKKALSEGVPKNIAGILVDEQFGRAIAEDAKRNSIQFAMPVEKSGQDEFDFEYDTDFTAHIEKFDPTFCKVLVRLNPDDEQTDNRQLDRLKKLGDYLKRTNRPYLFELLVPATEKQLAQVGGDVDKYDREIRPKLMVRSIAMIQKHGIEPDLWKIEGIDSYEAALLVSQQVQAEGRKAGMITLGRGADAEKVTEWLKVGSRVPGVVGFAIGRTIFWDALKGLKDGKYTKQKAIDTIAENYKKFAQLWVDSRNE